MIISAQKQLTHTLTQLRSSDYSWQDSAVELLQEATSIGSKFIPWVVAGHFFQRPVNSSSIHQVFLLDRSQWRMIREQVVFPILHNKQGPRLLVFLEVTLIKIWQFTVGTVVVVTPWRLLCVKFVFLKNKNMKSWVRCEKMDATRIATRSLVEIPFTSGNEHVSKKVTRLFLEIPTTFGNEDTTRNDICLLLESTYNFLWKSQQYTTMEYGSKWEH